MKLIPLPAFQDNYLWLLHDGQRAQPAMAFLQRDGLQLDAILVTRHHADYMGAVGHTSGDIAYYGADFDGVPLLFCGPTLLSDGCRRLFEGTPAQMLASLDNLEAPKFARAVEPHDAELIHHTPCRRSVGRHGHACRPSAMEKRT